MYSRFITLSKEVGVFSAVYGKENIRKFLFDMENVILKISLENLREAFSITKQAMDFIDIKRNINNTEE